MLKAVVLMMAATMGSAAAAQGAAQTELAAVSIAGDWSGTLEAGGQSIPLVFHVAGASGAWTATLDSPAQGALGIPVASVARDGAAIRFTLATPAAVYAATLGADGQRMTGTFTQGGAALPLTLTRGAAPAAVGAARPQTPRAPFPYRIEDAAYDNAAGHAHLTGTLTLPAGAGPFPVALLITGSGSQDRDETIFAHKPFLVWADYLTRRGIAVLRVDDRGVGGSTGEVRTATTADFAGDVAAGVAYLRSRRDIDPRRVGLIGHSEGGVIAPIVAARDPRLAFIVLLAGSGQTGEDLLLAQKRLIETGSGTPAPAVERSVATMRRLYGAVATAPDQATATARLATAWQSAAADQGLPATTPMPAQLAIVASPWMRWFLAYDPRPTLAQVRCPVLAIGGAKDVQVPATENLAGIKAATAGNRDVTAVELPGLNHLLQTAGSGMPTEYATIEQTVAPVALATVGDWLVARVSAAPPS